MDIVDIALYKLKHDGINARREDNHIVWNDDFNDEYSIFEHEIAYSDGKMAWFQSSYQNRFLLRLLFNGEYFSWEPITHNNFFGCNCELIEWYDDYLVFVYQEKHDVYICIVKDNKVTYFNFHGVEIARKDDVFFFREYRSQSLPVLKRLKIPELIFLEPITVEDALKEGIVVSHIGYPNNLSHQQ